MIFLIELIVEFLLIWKFYREKEQSREIFWFFTAMVVLYPSLTIGFGFPQVCWLFSIIATVKFYMDGRLKRKWRDFPMRWPLILIMLFHLIQPFFIHWRPIVITYLFEIRYIMTTYYLIFLGYCMSPKYDEIWKCRKWIYCLIAVIIVIGYSCYILGNNYLAMGISDDTIWTADRAFTERGFRVTGTQSSPNIFGYINVILLMFVLHFEKSRLKNIVILLLLLNIVFTGTRAPMLGLLISVCAYYAYFKKSRLIITTFILVPIALITINFIDNPTIQKYISGVEDLILTGGQNTGGSDAELRQQQMVVSFAIGTEKPITGHGIGYLTEMISENGMMSGRYYGGLAGGEGYLFWVFMDYGFVYLGLVILFFLMLLWYLLRNRNIQPQCVPIATAFTVALMTHLLTSRPEHSWEILFPLIGLFIGIIKKNENKNYYLP